MKILGIALLVAIVGALLAAATFLIGFNRGWARGERSWRDGWNAGYDEAVSYWGTRLAREKQQAAASEAPKDAPKETDAAPGSEKPSPSKKPN